MYEQDNLALVQKTYNLFGQGELNSVLSNFDEQVIWRANYPSVVPFAGEWKGADGFLQFFTIVGESLELKEFVPFDFICQDNKVAVIGYEVAVVKATGIEYRNDWVQVWHIEEGKVIDFTSFNDTATVAQAFSGG